MTNKFFYILVVFVFVGAQALYAAEDKAKGFTFYSNKKSTEVKTPDKPLATAEVKSNTVSEVMKVEPPKAMPSAFVAKPAPPIQPMTIFKEPANNAVIAPVVKNIEPVVKPVASLEEASTKEATVAPKVVATPKVEAASAQIIAPVKVPAPIAITAEQKQKANLNALQQRLANNKSMTDAQKNELVELMISQSPKEVDFLAKEQEKNVLFFESAGNDPNMTIDQKKQAIKKHLSEPPVEEAKAPVAPVKVATETPKEQPKEQPKKFKLF